MDSPPPLREQLRSLAQAARELPSMRMGSGTTSPNTLWRWANHGLQSRGGAIVRLETWRYGGSCVTSAEAIQRFFAALNSTDPAPKAVTHDDRQARVEAQLDRLGVG